MLSIFVNIGFDAIVVREMLLDKGLTNKKFNGIFIYPLLGVLSFTYVWLMLEVMGCLF